jgi:cell division transport system permease protein
MKTVKTSWKQIRRTPHQALAAIFIMMLTFLSISVFAFIIFGSAAVIQYFESKPQVTAFFTDEATSAEIKQLESNLNNTDKISSVRFVSKKEALEIYKEQNKDDPLLLELVTEDILPASLEISTYRISDLDEVSSALNESPIVSEVVYQKDVVATLSQWTDAVRMIGIVIIIILALVSIFIMMTVIGFKVSQKRDEIEIMKLLSATNWYIRTPFMFEGIFYGAAGTILGWLIASVILLYATPYLETFLRGIPVLPVSPVFLIGLLGIELLVAIGLGVLASYLAVLRYLK